MKASTKVYRVLRAMTVHVPYNDIEIDIEALQNVKGGDFIIGIRKLGTTSFIYRKPCTNWLDEYKEVTDTWPNIEWYCGSVNEGWIVSLSDKDVPKMLNNWLYMHFAK
ncbi:MAG TPA: hypothetical protein DDW90_08195 [Cyanobacteria bacterium UBA9971]|nr:MAG: hypothetical protein UR95_C0010G0013 [Parcubacteria group bacterium GW2011_GWC1_36_108]HBG49464.1 hypothetical protein [Cyanobacteria bacterium UBA9971]HCR36141.1 hypothetical protein [Candidatus Woesebacteria bacterium]